MKPDYIKIELHEKRNTAVLSDEFIKNYVAPILLTQSADVSLKIKIDGIKITIEPEALKEIKLQLANEIAKDFILPFGESELAPINDIESLSKLFQESDLVPTTNNPEYIDALQLAEELHTQSTVRPKLYRWMDELQPNVKDENDFRTDKAAFGELVDCVNCHCDIMVDIGSTRQYCSECDTLNL